LSIFGYVATVLEIFVLHRAQEQCIFKKTMNRKYIGTV
jgi:hypothetical protein